VRASDRWITPAIVVVLLLCGTLVVLAGIGSVAYLTARGIDPDPMLKLAGELLAAVSGTVSLVLQLANRRTTTKVERNTGRLEAAVWDVHDALPRPSRHAYPETAAVDMNVAPGPRGS
jgi:hypothetical protein